MIHTNLTVVTSLDDPGQRTWLEQSLAAWSDPAVPVKWMTWADALEPEHAATVRQSVLAWVCVDAAMTRDQLYQILDQATRGHVPVLLTPAESGYALGQAFQDDVVCVPRETEASVAGGLSQAMWCQAHASQGLKAEVRLLRAHQDGLCDQMDRIDEELRLATQLQREFLPDAPGPVHDLTFRVFFRPAGYVSGDIYDICRLDEDHVGVFLADAVGHGVPAALMTMYIKHCMPMKETDPALPHGYRIIPPDEAISRLNVEMIEQQQTGNVRFATACYALINCRTGLAQIARAGHPFPLLLAGDGHTEAIEPDGALLAVFAEEQFQVQTVQLAAGDRLVIYSDGFELAIPDGHQLCEDQTKLPKYTHAFEQLREGDEDHAIGLLAAQLDDQAGSLHQRDDLTALLVSVDKNAQFQRSPGDPASTREAA